MTLYVIGDSQVSLFTGKDEIAPQWPLPSDDRLEGIHTFRLGSILIQNWCEYGAKSLQWQRLFACLDTITLRSDVLLVFGEIDCRTQLVKQLRETKRALSDIAFACAACYFEIIEQVAANYRVLVWHAPPQSEAMHSSNKYPTAGTMQERNEATSLFNWHLGMMCEKAHIPFISIFAEIVDRNMVSDTSYFMDSAHLSQKALPLALEALKPYITLP